VQVTIDEPPFKPPQSRHFTPQAITVTGGTLIVWTNTGAVAHTVTAQDGKTFDSGNLAPRATFQFTPRAPGAIAYYCAYHPWMIGTITILPAGASASGPEAVPPSPTPQPLSSQARPAPGFLAPDFTVSRLDTGAPLRLRDLRGRLVWLNFWATWCSYCHTEMPAIQQVYAQYKSMPIVIVGVDMGEDAGPVHDYVARRQYGWTFVLDPGQQVARAYAVVGPPTHVFIRPDGVIADIYPGELNHHEMEEYLDALLEPQQ